MQLRNVPATGPRYWTAIVAASMCGANMGDFFARTLHLGHVRGLLPLAAMVAAVLWAEHRAKRASQAYYWLTIIILRTAATNLADLGAQDLRLGWMVVEGGLTALLIGLVACDRRRGASDVPMTTPLYWAAMLTAGTLGTASGDYVADDLGLGTGIGSIVLGGVLVGLLWLAYRRGGISKAWYWVCIVAARTAGTTMGDWLAGRHGADLGLPLSLAVTGAALVAILVLWQDRPRHHQASVLPL